MKTDYSICKDICQGNVLCRDKSDLEECGTDKDEIDCSANKCTTSLGHEQCLSDSYYQTNDGIYDCLSREDEIVSDSRSYKDQIIIPYEEIKSCSTETGFPGLQCGERCLGMDYWCRKNGEKGSSNLCDIIRCKSIVCKNTIPT